MVVWNRWEHERKLRRAAEHFEQLRVQIEGWERGDGYVLWTDPDPDPPCYTLRVEIDRPIEDEPFPLTLGDFLQNARSALDYLACALGDYCAGGMMDERDALVTSFPIAANPDRFAQVVNGRLPTVTDHIRAKIEDLQPYKTGGEAWNFEPLWILNELARIDRHRFLHLGYERIGHIRLDPRTSRNVKVEELKTVKGPFSNAELEGIEEAAAFGGDDTAIVAWVTAFPINPDEEVQMDWEGVVQITFDQHRIPASLPMGGEYDIPMLDWVRGIVPAVQRVISTLAPYLPAEPPTW